MKKSLLWSTAVLSLLALSGCTQSQSQSDTSESISEQSAKKAETDWMAKAKDAIDQKKFNEAKTDLNKALKADDSDKQAKAMLSQVEKYLSAQDKLQDKQYSEAKKEADEGARIDNGSAKMVNYFKDLTEQINKKEKEAKTKESSQKASKTSSQSQLYTAYNLNNSQKDEINQKMWDWCAAQAKKGKMSTIDGTMFASGRWYDLGMRVYMNSTDGDILTAQIPEDIADQSDIWKPTEGKINAVGGSMFYTPDSDGEMVGGPGDTSKAKLGSEVHYYLWADNGKVYELTQKVTGKGEGRISVNVGRWVSNGKDEPVKDDGINRTYIVSKDEAAQQEYQDLLKEAGASKGGSPKSTSTTSKSKSLWNSDKSLDLMSAVDDWADNMGQSYRQATLNSSDNTVITNNGLSLVSASNYQPTRGIAIFEEQPVSVSRDGKGSGYQIVDCYAGNPGEGDEATYVYLFVLNNGKPQVLFCDTSKDVETKGSSAYANFKPTSNQELQTKFADIVNS